VLSPLRGFFGGGALTFDFEGGLYLSDFIPAAAVSGCREAAFL
jgi:hypothetical protein